MLIKALARHNSQPSTFQCNHSAIFNSCRLCKQVDNLLLSKKTGLINSCFQLLGHFFSQLLGNFSSYVIKNTCLRQCLDISMGHNEKSNTTGCTWDNITLYPKHHLAVYPLSQPGPAPVTRLSTFCSPLLSPTSDLSSSYRSRLLVYHTRLEQQGAASSDAIGTVAYQVGGNLVTLD